MTERIKARPTALLPCRGLGLRRLSNRCLSTSWLLFFFFGFYSSTPRLAASGGVLCLSDCSDRQVHGEHVCPGQWAVGGSVQAAGTREEVSTRAGAAQGKFCPHPLYNGLPLLLQWIFVFITGSETVVSYVTPTPTKSFCKFWFL